MFLTSFTQQVAGQGRFSAGDGIQADTVHELNLSKNDQNAHSWQLGKGSFGQIQVATWS